MPPSFRDGRDSRTAPLAGATRGFGRQAPPHAHRYAPVAEFSSPRGRSPLVQQAIQVLLGGTASAYTWTTGLRSREPRTAARPSRPRRISFTPCTPCDFDDRQARGPRAAVPDALQGLDLAPAPVVSSRAWSQTSDLVFVEAPGGAFEARAQSRGGDELSVAGRTAGQDAVPGGTGTWPFTESTALSFARARSPLEMTSPMYSEAYRRLVSRDLNRRATASSRWLVRHRSGDAHPSARRVLHQVAQEAIPGSNLAWSVPSGIHQAEPGSLPVLARPQMRGRLATWKANSCRRCARRLRRAAANMRVPPVVENAHVAPAILQQRIQG